MCSLKDPSNKRGYKSKIHALLSHPPIPETADIGLSYYLCNWQSPAPHTKTKTLAEKTIVTCSQRQTHFNIDIKELTTNLHMLIKCISDSETSDKLVNYSLVYKLSPSYTRRTNWNRYRTELSYIPRLDYLKHQEAKWVVQ